jgi:replicative DNA helicase
MNLDEALFGAPQAVVEKPQEITKPKVLVSEEALRTMEKETISPLFQKMQDRIKEMDEYSWRRGEMGGLDWGFDQLNHAFEGLNPGLILCAGQSNIGKSGFMMQLGQQIAYANQVVTDKKPKKAFVLFFSLDDNFVELAPRFIAIDQKIPINVVKSPKKYVDAAPEHLERREAGLKRFNELSNHFALQDANDGTDLEYIQDTAERYAFELSKIDPDYQLVLFIDNFHDVTVRDIKFGSDTSGKYDHIADGLSKLATKLDCPVICSAEFRKLNGNRRPILDDIRESVKIVYEAKAIMLCYNEVGLRQQQAQIFWKRNDSPDNQPIYEVKIGKNKYSSYKGRIFYEFVPEMSFFREVPAVGAQRYNQMISG